MINLLPPAAYKKIVREYYLRVVTVALFLLGTTCLLGVVSLSPSYILTSVQMSALKDGVMHSSEKVASYDTSVAELKKANEYALKLQGNGVTLFTDYQQSIENESGSDITVTAMRFARPDSNKPATISIDGTARDRQSLATFRDTLAARADFARVDLPISNLIKEKDISFSIQITTATSTSPSS
jgi:hypothetical protein